MFDFSIQKRMLYISMEFLEEKGLDKKAAFGGGTALSGYYWGHRYSTDIDIFIHSEDDIIFY